MNLPNPFQFADATSIAPVDKAVVPYTPVRGAAADRFLNSVSPGEITGSLPSGESDPSVTTDWSPGESRFVLDEAAFVRAIEPPICADELVDVLAVLAGY